MNPILISTRICNQRRFLAVAAVTASAAFVLATTSCSTTRGFGRDVQKVGEKIETEAVQTGGTQ